MAEEGFGIGFIPHGCDEEYFKPANCFTINANNSAIDNVGWKQVEDMEFCELKDGKTRTKIDKSITINRWY